MGRGSASSRELRGGSEPPRDFNEKTGLKRSVFPIKVAGITFGSQENLNQLDDDQPVNPFLKFGQRTRRSVTPLRNGGTAASSVVDEDAIQAPFGMAAGTAASHGGNRIFPQRSSGIGAWGQRIFNNSNTTRILS